METPRKICAMVCKRKLFLSATVLAYTWYILVVSRALVICPDMYTHALGLGPNGPRARVYVHIRQITRAHDTAIK